MAEGEHEDVTFPGDDGTLFTMTSLRSAVRSALGGHTVDDKDVDGFLESDAFREVLPQLYHVYSNLNELIEKKMKNMVRIKKEVVVKTEPQEERLSSVTVPLQVPPIIIKKERIEVKEEMEEPSSAQPQGYDSDDTCIIRKKKKKHKEKDKDKSPKNKERDRDKDKERDKSKDKERDKERKKEKKHHNHDKHREKEKEEKPPQHQHTSPALPRLKPYSFYNSSYSKTLISGKTWKPVEEMEYSKYEKKFKLVGASVLCCDIAKLSKIFHNPAKGSTRSDTIPLKRNMIISYPREKEIERQANFKCMKLKPVLTDMYLKYKRNTRVGNRFAISSSSNSGSDGGGVKKQRRPSTGHDGAGGKGHRVGTAEYQKEQRKKNLEKLSAQVDRKNRTTRKLPWEDRDYFEKKEKPGGARDKKTDKATEKGGPPRPQLSKIPKINQPPTPFAKILMDIAKANKSEEKKPQVELKIPKNKDSEYVFKRERVKPFLVSNEGIDDYGLAAEVDRLLKSNSSVECPSAFQSMSQLPEYTIRKIAWWFLKEEQDPPVRGICHPELHDDEIHDEYYDPAEHEDDDNMSFGCVSDSEETGPPKVVKPVYDSDILDEYCGFATVQEAQILNLKVWLASEKKEKSFIKLFTKQPGTNVYKSNIVAKCYVCQSKLMGNRSLGAHIRSPAHKNNFRNFSLDMTDFQESWLPQPPTKIFVAKLVKYTVDDTIIPSGKNDVEKQAAVAEETEDFEQPDSPMAIIDSQIPEAEIVRLENMNADDLSLPSAGQYDLDPDTDQLRAKICLRTNGIWVAEMEDRWVQMQEKETKITQQYNDERDKYINAPESHPLHGHEWARFWERRNKEAEGGDVDYAGEWKNYWLKRVQEIMKTDVEQRIQGMKRGLRLDSQTLLAMCQRHGVKPVPANEMRKELTAESSRTGPKSEASAAKTKQTNGNQDSNKNSNNPTSNRNAPYRASGAHNANDHYKRRPPFTDSRKTHQQPPSASFQHHGREDPRRGGPNNMRGRGKIERGRNKFPSASWRKDSNDQDRNRRDRTNDVRHFDQRNPGDRKRDYDHRNERDKNHRDRNSTNQDRKEESKQHFNNYTPMSPPPPPPPPPPRVVKNFSSPLSDWESEEPPTKQFRAENTTNAAPGHSGTFVPIPQAKPQPQLEDWIIFNVLDTGSKEKDSSALINGLADLKEAMQKTEHLYPTERSTKQNFEFGRNGIGLNGNASCEKQSSPVMNTSVIMSDVEAPAMYHQKATKEQASKKSRVQADFAKQFTATEPVSSPESGEIDSGTSSAGMEENHRRLIIPRGTAPNLSGLIETCNLDRNSLGYQLLVKNLSGGHPSALASNNTPSQKNLQCRNDGFQL